MTHLKFLFMIGILIISLAIGCKKEEELIYENKFTLFEQPELEGSKAEYNIATMLVENQLRKTGPDGSDDAASSVSWSLAPGIIVYLFQDEDGTGKVMRLEGNGRLNLAENGMDNIVSAVVFRVE